MRRVLTLALVAATVFVAFTSIDASARSTAASWSGRWNRLASEIDPAGPTTFTLHQAGNHLTGTFPWKGCTTRKGGSAVGWTRGRAAVLAFRQTDGSLVLAHLNLSADGTHITGAYEVTAGTCSASGPFSATRVS